MAIDTFMKLGSIKGESTVLGFQDQIVVSTWSWGVSQNVGNPLNSPIPGQGLGSGRVTASTLNFTHSIDTATVPLLGACCAGEHFDKAVLTMRKAGGTAMEYFTVEFSNVLVAKVALGGESSGDQFSETVDLFFLSYKASYQAQNSKGAKLGGAIVGGYDLAKLVKL